MEWRDFFDKTPKWNAFQLSFVSLSFCSFTMNHVFSKYAHYSMMSAIAYVVYYVILVVICAPLIYVQLKLGGKLQKGIVGIFGVSIPILKGAGIAVLITTFIRSLTDSYHMGILAFYAFQSLKTPFPWAQDDVRKASEGIDDTGTFYWWLPTCNAAVWGLVFIGICGGLKWVGIVLSVLGSVAVTLSITLLAYGREEFSHTAAPEKNFYKVDWKESLAPDTLTAFTDSWVPIINMTIIIAAVFFGSYPTIGKCLGQKPIITHTSWIPVVLVLSAMPHLFINMLAPYLDAAALALGVTDSQLIVNSGQSNDSLFLLLPRILSALNVTHGIAFIWFLTFFVYSLMNQILHGAVIVDNLMDWLKHSSFNCFSHKSALHFALSFIYCAVAIVLSLPMVTQGGYYVVYLVAAWSQKSYGLIGVFVVLSFIIAYARVDTSFSCQRIVMVLLCSLGGFFCCATFIYFAKFDEEIQAFSVFGRDAAPVVYPKWAYALGWLVCLGPIVLGLLLGLMHACCSSGRGVCSSGAYSDEASTENEVDVLERKTSKDGYLHDYRNSHEDYLERTKMRRY